MDSQYLDPWKSSILEQYNISSKVHTHPLHLKDKDQFYIVSDGGISDFKGIFGIVISDGINILASNKGKIYSVDYLESAFRSEMYGLLSSLVTFQAMMANTVNNKEVILHIYSDNKPVIKRINERRWRRRTVNQYRASDVDIELQVLEEIKILEQKHFKVILKYVKGHQDLHKSKKTLTHKEKLNVMADILTKEAQYLQDKKDYIPLPTNNVNLILNQEYINSKYSPMTKKAYHSINFRQYLQQRHDWCDRTIESVWWKVYYKSWDKFIIPDKDRILKFIHDKLPTNKREHRRYDFKSSKCEQCKPDTADDDTGEVEDEDHIIRCSSVDRKKLRQDWLLEIETFLQQDHTPENVRVAISDGMQHWLQQDNNPEQEEKDYGIANKPMKQQQAIGWRHFIRGRISIEWGNCIHDHIQKQAITGITADQWGSMLLSINWKHILTIWKARNATEHGNTTEEQEAINCKVCIHEIENIFASNEGIINSSIVELHVEDLKAMTSAQLTTYLYSLKILVRMYRQKHKKVRYKPIAEYFTNLIADKMHQLELNMKVAQEDRKDKSELDPGDGT